MVLPKELLSDLIKIKYEEFHYTFYLPKKENQILDEDPDAVIAALVAVIDFHKETGKDAEIISIKQIEG